MMSDAAEKKRKFIPVRLPPNWREIVKLWGFSPLPYQEAFLSILAGETRAFERPDGTTEAARLVLVAAGIRSGKSFGTASVMPAMALGAQQDCTFIIGSIQHRQSSEIFNEVMRCFDELDRHLGGNPTSREGTVIYKTRRPTEGEIRVQVPSGAIVTVIRFSMENPDAIRGMTVAFAVLDELAWAKPQVAEDFVGQVMQRVATTEGQILVASSPRGLNWFGRSILNAERIAREEQAAGRCLRTNPYDPVAIRAPSWSNPLVGRDLLKSERERLSRHEWAQNYCAEITTPETSIFRGYVDCVVRDLFDRRADDEFSIGFDPSTSAGKDWSAVVVLHKPTRRIVHAARWRNLPVEVVVHKVAAIALHFDAAVSIDATGIGAVVAERLRPAGVYGIEMVKFTVESKERMAFDLLAQIERGPSGLQLPDPDTIDDDSDWGHDFRSSMKELLLELELYQCLPKPSGAGFDFGVPEGGGNDDLATALMLALRRCPKSTAPTSQVSSVGNLKQQRRGHHSADNDSRSRVFNGGYSVGSSILGGRGYF